jgi:hypothetical protein
MSADDCNIYVQSERSGHRVMESISRFIERRLRLKVNQAKSAVAKPEGRHFLGFRLRREPLERTGSFAGRGGTASVDFVRLHPVIRRRVARIVGRGAGKLIGTSFRQSELNALRHQYADRRFHARGAERPDTWR